MNLFASMIVSVEGNIGAGKSSLLEELEIRGLNTFKEPLDEWKEWLDRFYTDRNRWAFSMQMKVLSSFARDRFPTSGVCVIERSCLSCKQVFGQLLYNQGNLGEKEWDLYRKFCDLVSWSPDLIIYVDTPPEVCISRIKERSRSGEDTIDVPYLGRLDFQYGNMLKYYKGDVLRVDGTKDSKVLADIVFDYVRGHRAGTTMYKPPQRK
jgi:deoxyadenosine/deoxycytidine kinase